MSAPTTPSAPSSDNSSLSWAKFYHSLGLCIIPIIPGKKKPKIEWKDFEEKRPTEEELKEWFSSGQSTLAVVCGRVSSGSVVIDIEKKEDFDKFYGERVLNDTLVTATPHGGRQVFVREKGQDIPRRKIRLCEEHPLDLCGDGGYVLVPPSIIDHEIYCRQERTKPECAIQGMTSYRIVSTTTKIMEVEGVEQRITNRLKQLGWAIKPRKPISEVLKGVPEGERNESAFNLARYLLHDRRLDEAATWQELQRWNEKNKPPLPLDELKTVFEQGKKYPWGEKESQTRSSTKGESEEEEERESQASALVKLATKASVTLFHDERREPYIQIQRGEALVTLRLRSKDARTWLSGLLWKDRAKAPNSEALSSALNVLEAKANEGEEIRLYNRVALGEDGSIWLDLCDEEWRAIHITKTGWEVVRHPPILFRRYSHQQPIPVPIRGGSLAPLLDYAHITHLGDQLLYLVTAITYLIPGIPHVVMIFYGPQGSGKTWALRVIRILIDPSQLDLLSLPTRYQEVVQNLDHNWCAFYDNVGRLSAWISDVFCRAVTGTGVSKRQLYTDDEDVIYQYYRCIGLTDINIAAERGDFLQRSLLLGLDAIPEKQRKTEKELRERLDQQRAESLGAMLDVLVKAINLYPKIQPSELYRMADYTTWGLAITQALGLDPQYFLDAYRENIDAQNLEAVRASPISDALILLMRLNPDGWSGTVSQLYSALEEQAKVLKISTRQKDWPKKPHVLSRVLNELAPFLPVVGLKVERGYRGHARLIYITTVGSVGELERQADWGKGQDLRKYLDEATDATVASEGISTSFPGVQTAPPSPLLPGMMTSYPDPPHKSPSSSKEGPTPAEKPFYTPCPGCSLDTLLDYEYRGTPLCKGCAFREWERDKDALLKGKTCGECAYWSPNRCEQFPELVMVSPARPACELFKPRGKEGGSA